ncbi:YfhO family protein [Macrococcus carouselicus]|uniref:YfhO family protein n=1 Tax=Macrococcus carouselicus TaxID=69969 RepID=A0A9Q8CJL6_9STAP|nr:YfhO family protein [Macrococcus carouselicus]TDM00754.1 hypothetical protein ERX40_09435 [Macrococcus carouselicus]
MLKRFIKIMGIALVMSGIFYLPDVYRYMADGVLYVGKGDGMKQMIPFQLYLYEHFKHARMWYDLSFGLGGDYFTSLSYYYSTSLVSYGTFALLHLYQLMDRQSTVEQLIHMQYVTAVLKCSFVFSATYYAAKEIGIRHKMAMLAAVLYSWSTIFYYFTFTWSFFSDVMIYLPLSVLGIERLLRRKKPLVFILSIAVTVFSNFYLAYYEMIAVGVYFLFRIIRQHEEDRFTRTRALTTTVLSAITGFMIGNIGFVAGVSSFLNNDRTLEKLKIPLLIGWSSDNNIFYGGFHLVVMFVAVIALFSFSLYRYYYYRLFAVTTWILMAGSLTPFVGSLFNGFSMPQRRWVYILAFSTAMLSALFIQHLAELSIRQLVYAAVPVVLVIIISALMQRDFHYWILYIPIILLLMMLYLKEKSTRLLNVIIFAIAMCQLTLIQDYHYGVQHKYFKTKDYMTEKVYNPAMQKEINQIKKGQADDFRRITLSDDSSVNVPMYYRFNGTMLYSSIFDKKILKFYEEELQIAQHKQKNSYYANLSGRTNLASLYNVDYFITAEDDHPTLFEKVDAFTANKTYELSKNPYPLPSVRVAEQTFAASSLHTPLARERAMLEGVVKETGTAGNFEAENILPAATLRTEYAEWTDGLLNVERDGGGLVIKLDKEQTSRYKELYITMKTDIAAPADKDFYVQVNEKKLMKPKKDYKYRREAKDIVMNIKATDDIHIHFPAGRYHLSLKSVQGEDYTSLKKAYHHYRKHPLTFTRKRNAFEVDLQGDKGTLVFPMPYAVGLKAYVDGEARPVEAVNYLMTGVPVKEGDRKVVLTYTPPYLKWGSVVMLLGLAGASLLNRWIRKNNQLS